MYMYDTILMYMYTYTYMHIFTAITTSTSVPLIAVEMEDTFNEVLEEHGGIPGQEEMNQTELGWRGRERGREGGREGERERESLLGLRPC